MTAMMTLAWRLDALAIDDIARAADWYDRQARGVGAKFIDEVGRVLERVARFPNAYVRVHRSVRRARVGRFPYFIAYELFAGELVVLGVFAEAQHPDRLLQRTGEA